MPTTHFSSNSLAYQQFGEATNPDLVLLHSGGFTKDEWQPFLKIWSADFHLTGFDLPGHGDSAPAVLSVRHFAEILGEAIAEVIPGDYHLLGSSLGGAVGLTHALTQPQRLRKYVHYRMGYRKSGSTNESTENMATPAYWEQYGLDKMLQKFHRPQANFREGISADEAWKTVISDVPTLMAAGQTDFDHRLEDLREIVVPVMLVLGDRDPIVPLSEALSMVEAIPDAALYVMPGASHITAANTWRKASFTDEIKRFLLSE